MIQDKWQISDNYKKLSIEILLDNLAPLRARIGITQEELASIIGVSRQTYYGIESRNREMTWTTYLAILFFFDSVQSTSEMLQELRVYPIDLILRFNGMTNIPRLD